MKRKTLTKWEIMKKVKPKAIKLPKGGQLTTFFVRGEKGLTAPPRNIKGELAATSLPILLRQQRR